MLRLLPLPLPLLALLPEAGAQDLHKAAQTGDLGRVRAMVTARPGLVRQTDDLQRLALHLAARYGRRDIAALLLERGADLEHAAYNGFTPLMLAASFNQKTLVDLLVEKGAKLETASNFGQTALDQAADRGHQEIVKLLASKGARYSLTAAVALNDVPGCQAAIQKTPEDARDWHHIWSAARRGHAKVAKLLLSHGAPTEAELPGSGPVPVLIPAMPHPEVVRALLEAGAEIHGLVHNYKGVANGSTALLYAATHGYTASAELLLTNKADVTAVTDRGWNALHCAASGGHVELVRRFLKLRVDPRAHTRDGWTPLSLAAAGMNPSQSLAKERGRLRQVIDALIAAEVELDLYTAVCIGHGQRVREILARKPQPERPKDRDLDAVLLKAVKFGHAQIADLLCAHGANPNQMEESGYTPLHWAAFWNELGVAKVLVDRGAKVDARGRRKYTALHEAARLGSAKIAELLIRAGADVNARDHEGKTPLQWATEFGDRSAEGWEAVRTVLKKHGGK